jgi:hypothetical protein
MTTQNTYRDGNLQVTQTIIETATSITKINDVERFNGENWEILPPNDPDHQRAMIMMHNIKISQ